MAGRDNPLAIMDEPSSTKPGGSTERDGTKHSHKGLFDTTDHLVCKFLLFYFTHEGRHNNNYRISCQVRG